MAGTTPTYGLRYGSLGDPPDGASQVQHLAEDVEVQLTRMDTIPLLQIYVANGTYTKPTSPTARYVESEQQAGGGGGGGCPSGSGQGTGGGGGGGAWNIKRWTASALPTSVPVVVGAGGIGGAPASPAGGTGGTSSFNGAAALGGTGGQQGTSTSGTTASAGGDGGTHSGGDWGVNGSAGHHGRILTGLTMLTERGGNSRLGFGAPANLGVGGGANGGLYGGGGSGCLTTNTSRTGGAGAQGIVIVRTWF
jgi:hypothetical protein